MYKFITALVSISFISFFLVRLSDKASESLVIFIYALKAKLQKWFNMSTCM